MSNWYKQAKSDWLFANSIFRSRHKAITVAIESWLGDAPDDEHFSARELQELQEWINQGVTKQTPGRGDGPSLSELQNGVGARELKEILEEEFALRVAQKEASLKDKLIKLGSDNPELRGDIRPILDKISKLDMSDREVEKKWNKLNNQGYGFDPAQDPNYPDGWDHVRTVGQGNESIEVYAVPGGGYVGVGGAHGPWAQDLSKKAARSSTSSRKKQSQIFMHDRQSDIEVVYDMFDNFLQVGMGGEWWTGELSRGKNIFHHRKEDADPAYKPVKVEVKEKQNKYVLHISGGFGGYETTLGLGFM